MFIPKSFEGDDLLFHYTSSKVAIDFVLKGGKLRLSPRKKSRDPIESMKLSFSVGLSAITQDEFNRIESSNKMDAEKLRLDVDDRINQVKQVCFCMNDVSGKYDKERFKPFEYFGCMEPRMWEQYGDEYSGVCLVFSKKRLIEKLEEDAVYDDVNYITYSKLSNNHNRIDLNVLDKIGLDDYRREYFKVLNKNIFNKHVGYVGENEFRVCCFSKEEFENISFEDALIGIVISDKASKDEIGKLKKFAEDNNIQWIKINWQSTGVSITNPRFMEELTGN